MLYFKTKIMARALVEEMMNNIVFVKILVEEIINSVFYMVISYSLQLTFLFITHKSNHILFSYMVPK